MYTIFMANLNEPPVALESSNETRQTDRTDDENADDGGFNNQRNKNVVKKRISNNNSTRPINGENSRAENMNINQDLDNQIHDDDEESKN